MNKSFQILCILIGMQHREFKLLTGQNEQIFNDSSAKIQCKWKDREMSVAQIRKHRVGEH